MVAKLPNDLKKCLKVNHDIVSCGECPTLKSVVDFFRLETEVHSDLVFGVLLKPISKKDSKFKPKTCVSESLKPVNSHSQLYMK